MSADPKPPQDVLVAKARVREDAQIELQAPAEVRVRAGQPVRVRYVYSLEETSKSRDIWRFLLSTKIGDRAKSPVTSRWDDRWGLRDKGWGSLQQEYLFDEPGQYDGSFEVRAEIHREAWKSGEVRNEMKKKRTGPLRIIVE